MFLIFFRKKKLKSSEKNRKTARDYAGSRHSDRSRNVARGFRKNPFFICF